MIPLPPVDILRSRRRTAAIRVTAERIVLRVPLSCTDAEAKDLLRRHRAWIESALRRAESAAKTAPPPLTENELRSLAEQAKTVIPERAALYAERLGVSYRRITIRAQRTRWGSCTRDGNLNFNCLLMLTPPEVLDAVVVHELCHRKEMNHSPRFYAEVLRACPDYERWDAWLKKNGAALLRRIPRDR